MTEINYQILEELLVKEIPELQKQYLEDQNLVGSKPLPHITYGTILNPYIIQLIERGGNEDKLKKIFGFIEKLASANDRKVVEVVTDTICEYILDNDMWTREARKYMGPKTLELSFGVEEAMNRPSSWSPELKERLNRKDGNI